MVISLKRRIHIDQLARPAKHKITKKFDPQTERLAQSVGRLPRLPSIQSIRDKRQIYRISERLKDLAKPVMRQTDIYVNAEPNKISQDVLKYKASPRIIELAQPRDRDTWDEIKIPDQNYSCPPRKVRTLQFAPPREKNSQWRYKHGDY